MKKDFFFSWGIALSILCLVSGCINSSGTGMDNTNNGSSMILSNIPAMVGYSEGIEIKFVHTECSDSLTTGMLTDMMNSPVFWVPGLSSIPDSLRGNVYSFTNGSSNALSVFDRPAGSRNYTPLRTLNKVTWQDTLKRRVLRSASEVTAAQDSGGVKITRTNIVINMPFVAWDGGNR